MASRLLVNGQQHELDVPAGTPLLSVLRDDLALMAARNGCGQGECGACYVLVDGRPAASCLLTVEDAAERELVTAEGLARGDALSPLQEAFLAEGALQCGFCTGGMLISATALLARQPAPGDAEIREALAPHLCRCGAYGRVIRAVRRAAATSAARSGATAAAGSAAGNGPATAAAIIMNGAATAPATAAEDRPLVAGRARLVADLRPPGLVRACVLHPPAHGARLRSLDDTAAKALGGVLAVIHEGDFVGVVARRLEQARAGVEALAAEWDLPPRPAAAAGRHLYLRPGIDAGDDPGPSSALAGAARVVEARYHTPFVASAPLGPSAGLADVRTGSAEAHAATQRPFGLRDEMAALLGLARDTVRVVAEPAASGHGGNSSADAALEAARLSRAVGGPVLVEWSRADEFHAAPNRPALTAHVRAALDAAGRLVAWASDVTTHPHVHGGAPASLPDHADALACGRNALPPYRVPATVELHVVPSALRTGAPRSSSGAPNVFAVESAIDELAAAAGADPLAFRLLNLEDARLRRALAAVAERSGWGNPGGRLLGLACAIDQDLRVAEVAEVAVASSGQVRLLRAWCAVDCGTLVDPGGARKQIECAIVQAASWALREELHHREGRIAAAAWSDYPVARFADAPDAIEVLFTGDGLLAPSGLGEAAVLPLAAAIANAVAAGTGARVRELPLAPARVLAAMPAAGAETARAAGSTAAACAAPDAGAAQIAGAAGAASAATAPSDGGADTIASSPFVNLS